VIKELTPEERAKVRQLLGREPQGDYQILVRTDDGDPVVLLNAPFLHDGTPMPTRYWLVAPGEIRRVGQLESDGGVNAAEAAIDPVELAAAHDRYAAERDAAIPPDHLGPRPSGGVAGTRVGVKCLHAHWAWHLAGGDDPVGRWMATRLEPVDLITVGTATTEIRLATGESMQIPWGPVSLTDQWLSDHDPPRPAALTNALGTVDDHLDDVARDNPSILMLDTITFTGPAITALAQIELGLAPATDDVQLTRGAAEEIFRLVATESLVDRAHNPGLPSDHVSDIVATCCIVVGFMRRFRLDEVTLHSSSGTVA
jgi:uncharacterized protein